MSLYFLLPLYLYQFMLNLKLSHGSKCQLQKEKKTLILLWEIVIKNKKIENVIHPIEDDILGKYQFINKKYKVN